VGAREEARAPASSLGVLEPDTHDIHGGLGALALSGDRRDLLHVVDRTDDPFPEEEAESERFVLAGRPHGEHALAIDLHEEGLLADHPLLSALDLDTREARVVHKAILAPGAAAVRKRDAMSAISQRQPLIPGLLDLAEEDLEKKRDLGVVVAVIFSTLVLALGVVTLFVAL
jgi:hypothetical protein